MEMFSSFCVVVGYWEKDLFFQQGVTDLWGDVPPSIDKLKRLHFYLWYEVETLHLLRLAFLVKH